MSQTKAQLIDGKAAEIQFNTGSASTPTIAFTGDTNTGIYSPGADQLAISTNGTGRLFVNASGYVSVGNTSPQALVHFGAGTSAPAFGTTSNLLYGCTAGQTEVQLRTTVNDVTGSFYTDSSGVNVRAASAHPLSFHTSNTERMRLDSSGRLGLGTSAPDSNLEIVNATGSADNNLLKLHSSAATSSANLILEVNNGNTAQAALKLDTANKLHLQTYGSGALNNRLSIDGDGKVGIGTTSPSAALEVAQTTDMAVIAGTSGTSNAARLEARSGNGTTSGKYAYIRFNNNDTNNQRYDVGTYGTDDLTFRDVKAGSTRMTLDTSGRLLVGTSSDLAPDGYASQLQVAATSYTASLVLRREGNDAGSPTLIFAKTRSGSLGGSTIVNNGDIVGSIAFYGADGTDVDSTAARIYCEIDGTPGANDMPGRLVFSTTADGASSPTERMRIKSNGAHWLTCENTAENLYFSNAASAGTTIAFIKGAHTGNPNVPGSGTESFKVWTNGNVENTNNSYTAISDIKLKENIVDAKSQWDDLKALRVVNYNLKPETGAETHKQLGLIAQEVETVCPGLVGESPDTDAEGNDLGTVTKSVNYSVLYMKAVKALQEAMERIETLEQRLNDAGIA
jgi:hypothetical protein